MSGTADPHHRTRWAGFSLALSLSAVLLFVSALGFLESLLFVLESHHVTRDFDFLRIAWSPTGRQIGGFALFVLLSHVVLALLVWVAARAWWQRYAHTGAQLRLFVLAAWSLWAFALLCANAALSPWSDAARFVRGIASLALGPVAVWHLVGSLALASLWPAAQDLWRSLALRLPRRAMLAGSAAVLLGLGATLLPVAPARIATADRPNVIIIGIDSLRLPWVGAFGGDLTPELDRFVADATLFEWSYTPLGRTFGAWMSLLTGQTPRTNGVRFNVMPPEAYAETVTLADRFRAAGWRTVFAMDEMRFAPIDEDLGFDQIIGPPIGAHDFLIATITDLPVTNVLTNTLVGRYLLPTIHANRTAAVSYQPASFDRLVWDELETDGRPLFLAVHFTLPHHPIFWATAPRTYAWPAR
jgi:hypothetical protein